MVRYNVTFATASGIGGEEMDEEVGKEEEQDVAHLRTNLLYVSN